MYAVPVFVFTAASWPQEQDISTERVYSSIQLVEAHLADISPDYRTEGAYTLRNGTYADLSDDQLVSKLHQKYGDSVNFRDIEETYNQSLQRLPRDKLNVVLYALAAWLIPLLAAYAIGAGVAWVLRGFRRNDV